MIALIIEFLKDLPIISDAIKRIEQLFTKTESQKEAETGKQELDESESMKQTGRPKWD